MARRLQRETINVSIIGIPALVYVLGTNRAASVDLILFHWFLLMFSCPILITGLDAIVPLGLAPKHQARAMLREIGIQVGGLGLATAGMLTVVTQVTRIPLSILVGGPLVSALVPAFLAYALISMTATWQEARQCALRAESSEARARQEALAARIRPHFLFNALNCIEELTDTQPASARIAVAQLARLLRSVLNASASPMSKLEDELRLVDDYLSLEKLRFGPRFTYDLPSIDGLSQQQMPSTILLTLAENAVKHGVEQRSGQVEVQIAIDCAKGRPTKISIKSPTGRGDSKRLEAGTGYGLHDVRERLFLAYGNQSELRIEREEESTLVEFVVP
jgi:hypothetical protein